MYNEYIRLYHQDGGLKYICNPGYKAGKYLNPDSTSFLLKTIYKVWAGCIVRWQYSFVYLAEISCLLYIVFLLRLSPIGHFEKDSLLIIR